MLMRESLVIAAQENNSFPVVPVYVLRSRVNIFSKGQHLAASSLVLERVVHAKDDTHDLIFAALPSGTL